MIHAETCRLGTVRMAELRQAIETHLETLRAEQRRYRLLTANTVDPGSALAVLAYPGRRMAD
jgi:hypothetical protein